jgi:hypothetical protein
MLADWLDLLKYYDIYNSMCGSHDHVGHNRYMIDPLSIIDIRDILHDRFSHQILMVDLGMEFA